MHNIGSHAAASLLLSWALASPVAMAQKQYDPGATDTQIKVGNFVPYTGMFSEYGAAARAEAAYFRMVNDRGGVNGRKITFVSLDSASDTSQALDLARKLVEQEQVLLTVGIWGAPSNLAIRQYMNDKKVPQLFVAAADSAFNDPAHFPWTMGFQQTRRVEGLLYARYILRTKPAAKIGILTSDDASPDSWLDGIREGLGDKAAGMIVKVSTVSYKDTSSLEAQIAALKNAGADVFFNLTIGKVATLAIQQAYDLKWHPLQFIPNASLSIAAFLEPAGLEKASGIICNARSKGWLKPQARLDPDVRAFLDFMKKYNPDASLRDANNVYGYEVAETLVEVLAKCGDNLTRANVMKQAANLDLELGMLSPGIRIKTSPTDYQPIKDLYLIQFKGHDWAPIGPVSSR